MRETVKMTRVFDDRDESRIHDTSLCLELIEQLVTRHGLSLREVMCHKVYPCETVALSLHDETNPLEIHEKIYQHDGQDRSRARLIGTLKRLIFPKRGGGLKVVYRVIDETASPGYFL